MCYQYIPASKRSSLHKVRTATLKYKSKRQRRNPAYVALFYSKLVNMSKPSRYKLFTSVRGSSYPNATGLHFCYHHAFKTLYSTLKVLKPWQEKRVSVKPRAEYCKE
jgi:hypothetical protein